MELGTVLRHSGLDNADVVLGVDGEPVTAAQQLFSGWAGLSAGDVRRLDLVRYGAFTEVVIEVVP